MADFSEIVTEKRARSLIGGRGGLQPRVWAEEWEGFSPGMNKRAPQEQRTFFVTAVSHGRRQVFRKESWANLFVEVCQENRSKGRFLMHEFVLMPDHFHMLLTPASEVSLEKSLQYIKGGFSFRVKRELRSNLEVWQPSFTEHRVKDWSDYLRHREYIQQNPVRARLVEHAADYLYGSASGRFELDDAPPWLKPSELSGEDAGLKPRSSTDTETRVVTRRR